MSMTDSLIHIHIYVYTHTYSLNIVFLYIFIAMVSINDHITLIIILGKCIANVCTYIRYRCYKAKHPIN